MNKYILYSEKLPRENFCEVKNSRNILDKPLRMEEYAKFLEINLKIEIEINFSEKGHNSKNSRNFLRLKYTRLTICSRFQPSNQKEIKPLAQQPSALTICQKYEICALKCFALNFSFYNVQTCLKFFYVISRFVMTEKKT